MKLNICERMVLAEVRNGTGWSQELRDKLGMGNEIYPALQGLVRKRLIRRDDGFFSVASSAFPSES